MAPLCATLLDPVVSRPNRYELRVVKRRAKAYESICPQPASFQAPPPREDTLAYIQTRPYFRAIR